MTAPDRPAPRRVPCPACGGPALFASENRWRPFCSARCRQIDLGAWASERYRVADATPPDGVPGEADPPPADRH